jgi:hypothetical protein
MKANFSFADTRFVKGDQSELDNHAQYLANANWSAPGVVGDKTGVNRTPPVGYESYTVVDVLGEEFVWMNEVFPKEKFKWYLWFESVFLVPEEMVPFLRLRWS